MFYIVVQNWWKNLVWQNNSHAERSTVVPCTPAPTSQTEPYPCISLFSHVTPNRPSILSHMYHSLLSFIGSSEPIAFIQHLPCETVCFVKNVSWRLQLLRRPLPSSLLTAIKSSPLIYSMFFTLTVTWPDGFPWYNWPRYRSIIQKFFSCHLSSHHSLLFFRLLFFNRYCVWE